jgi:hypothetical protein
MHGNLFHRAGTSGADLTFATHLAASLRANVKSKSSTSTYIASGLFDSNIRAIASRNGMRMLESDH